MVAVVAGQRAAAWLLGLSVIGASGSAQQRPVTELVVQSGHSRWIGAIAVAPAGGGYLVSGGDDHAVVLWDVATGRQIRRFDRHTEPIVSVSVDTADRVLSASLDGSLYLWDAKTGDILQVLSQAPRERKDFEYGGDQRPIYAAALDPGGRYAVAGRNDGIEQFDLATGRRVGRIERRGLFGQYRIRITALAFLPGRAQLVSGARDEVRLWDLAGRKSLRTFKGHRDTVTCAAAAPDGAWFVTGGRDSTVALWRPDSSRPIETLKLAGPVRALAASPDGRYVLASDLVAGTVLWEPGSGAPARPVLPDFSRVGALTVSPDGAWVYAGGPGTVIWWSFPTGARAGLLHGGVKFQMAMAVGESTVLTGGSSTTWTWDLRRGRASRSPRREAAVQDVALTRDAAISVVGWSDSTVFPLDRTGRRTLNGIRLSAGAPTAMALDPEGGRVAAGLPNGEIVLWRFLPGHGPPGLDSLRWLPARDAQVYSLAFSPDGRSLVAAALRGIRLWSIRSGESSDKFRREDTDRLSGAQVALVSPNGCCVLGAGYSGDIRLWDSHGRELHQYIRHEGPVLDLKFALDGDHFYSSGQDKRIIRWDTASEGPELEFQGNSPAEKIALSPDGSLLFALGRDGAVRIWRTESARLVATLITADELGTDTVPAWTVVAPDGRFDTNMIEQVKFLRWVAADRPLTPMPLDIFMRDYFEPDLLAKLLAGRTLPPVADVSTLNRLQPEVRIRSVSPVAGKPGQVEVTVTVQSVRQAGAGGPAVESGVYDLRLFRDGQLVGQSPRINGEPSGHELMAWRGARRVTLDAAGRAEVRLPVRLPRGATGGTALFSAYAFNADRVKGPTDTLRYAFPAVSGRRRAFVIAVGVGENTDPTLKLSFAATDAARVMETFAMSLRASGDYDSVIAVPVLAGADVGVVQFSRLPDPAIRPTRENIRTVLDLLAGHSVDPARLQAMPQPYRSLLSRAEPQDLVLLSVAAHGLVDPVTDEFRFLPLDAAVGQGGSAPEFPRAITAAELSLWLRDVDAGAMVMVLSTCYSQSAVQAGQFKPGPLGDPGLGQLAYDKAMQILVGAEEKAIGDGGLSYLSQALIQEGPDSLRLRPGRVRPVFLTDLLRFAERRVPELSRQRGGPHQTAQSPTLFDFRKGRSDVRLYR